MKRLAKRLLLFFMLATIVILAFLAGVFLAPLIRSSQSTAGVFRTQTSSRTEQDLSVLAEAWRVIERDYYDKLPDARTLTRGAVQGLVNALDDPYSAYQTSDDIASSQREIDGSLQSLGMAVEKRDDQLVVVTPLTSSPAQHAGIRTGDRIVQIDGRDTASLTLGEAVNLLRGPNGSKVLLSVVRNNTDALTFTVERGDLTSPLVSSLPLSDALYYVNVSFFDSSVSRDLNNLLQQLQSRAVRGVILDLRNNPGGYLDVAIEAAGAFIGDGVIVSQQGRAGVYTWSYQDQGKQIVIEGPDGKKSIALRYTPLPASVFVAVLVNRGTASAAEVLAAALQDHGRAVIIGERTFGKGAVTGDYTLSDGSSIHMTNGQWFSPKGRSVTGVGLTPDVQIADDAAHPEQMVQQAAEILLAK
jgi:carboxyl-terminal processing protease